MMEKKKTEEREREKEKRNERRNNEYERKEEGREKLSLEGDREWREEEEWRKKKKKMINIDTKAERRRITIEDKEVSNQENEEES